MSCLVSQDSNALVDAGPAALCGFVAAVVSMSLDAMHVSLAVLKTFTAFESGTTVSSADKDVVAVVSWCGYWTVCPPALLRSPPDVPAWSPTTTYNPGDLVCIASFPGSPQAPCSDVFRCVGAPLGVQPRSWYCTIMNVRAWM